MKLIQILYGYLAMFSFIFLILTVCLTFFDITEFTRSLISVLIVIFFIRVDPLDNRGPLSFALRVVSRDRYK